VASTNHSSDEVCVPSHLTIARSPTPIYHRIKALGAGCGLLNLRPYLKRLGIDTTLRQHPFYYLLHSQMIPVFFDSPVDRSDQFTGLGCHCFNFFVSLRFPPFLKSSRLVQKVNVAPQILFYVIDPQWIYVWRPCPPFFRLFTTVLSFIVDCSVKHVFSNPCSPELLSVHSESPSDVLESQSLSPAILQL